MQHPLKIDVIPADAEVVLRLRGEMDLGTVDTLRACVDNLDEGFRSVALDLGALTFIDSTGLACLATLHRDLEPQFRHLELRGATGHVRHVLEVSGLSEVIPTSWDQVTSAS